MYHRVEGTGRGKSKQVGGMQMLQPRRGSGRGEPDEEVIVKDAESQIGGSGDSKCGCGLGGVSHTLSPLPQALPLLPTLPVPTHML